MPQGRRRPPPSADALALAALGATVSQLRGTRPGQAVLAGLAAVVCGCWYLTPVSEWVTATVVNTIPLEEDVELGRRAVREARYRILPREADYGVSEIGRRIVSANPELRRAAFRWSFEVIDQPGTINAFAYPGGFVFITKDLVTKLDASRAELASILGHEIGHVVHRHSQRRLVQSQFISFVWRVLTYDDGDARQETFGQAAGELLMGFVGHLGTMKFSRANEYEADEAGWELCTDAGIDPRGMISFFRKLLRLHGGSGASSWDSTHPGTADRIVALEEKWRQVPAGARRNLGAA